MTKPNSPLQGQNVLVTGASGLVGGHLAEALANLGARVFATIRSRNPASYFVSRGLEEKVATVYCDLANYDRILEIAVQNEISYIFHVAAQALVPAAYLNPRQTFLTNVMGTVNVLEAARSLPNLKAVVVASSDKAYGKDCLEAKEDQKLDGDHPYDVSKASADLIARAYHRTYGLPAAVSRFGNIFGPGDLNFNRIVPGAMEAIILQKPLLVRSDGSFVRDYVFVKDVVDGYILLAENIERVRGEAFNFSTGCNFSVEDLIKKISAVLSMPCDYRILNVQKNEIPLQSLNFEKAKKVLGWESRYSLEDGLRLTYEWYKSYFGR